MVWKFSGRKHWKRLEIIIVAFIMNRIRTIFLKFRVVRWRIGLEIMDLERLMHPIFQNGLFQGEEIKHIIMKNMFVVGGKSPILINGNHILMVGNIENGMEII